MKKNYKDLSSIKFRCMEATDIPECVELIAETFSMFDPFSLTIQIKKEDLLEIIKKELNKIKHDHLVTICLNEKNQVIGCYAGFKLSKIPEFKALKLKIPIISIDKKIISEKEEKLKILKTIDNSLFFNRYQIHMKNNELENTIFCDYFCISVDYFQSDLSRILAWKFFENCKKKGIRHIYGSFYNEKAIKLLTKNFDAEIVDKQKIVFIDDNEQYEIILLYGDLNNFKKANF